MKRRIFKGIDTKIVDLLNTHGVLSTIELANYLACSRWTILTTCKKLVETGKLKTEIIKNGNHEKYFPRTMIYSINKDYKPNSYAVPMDDYMIESENNLSEYLTKESAKLLFDQLIAVIEDQAKEIDKLNKELDQHLDLMASHVRGINHIEYGLTATIHIIDILGSAVALNGYQHAKPQPSFIERIKIFKEHQQILNNIYPTNCCKN
jgi:hypothetical protein